QLNAAWSERIALLDDNDQPIQWLTAHPGIASFGLNPLTGELLMANVTEGVIRKLVASPSSNSSIPIPQTLQDTGAFADLATLAPNAGVVPYEINVPFWSDNALKRRWFSVPNGEPMDFDVDAPWNFPSGTVWIKHFDLPLTNGQPASAVPIE